MNLFLSVRTVTLVHLVVSVYVLFHLPVLECHSRCTKRSEEFSTLVFSKTLRKKGFLSSDTYFCLYVVFLNIGRSSEFDLNHCSMLFWYGCCSVSVSWIWYGCYSNNWIYSLQAQLVSSALFKHKFSVEIYLLSHYFNLKSSVLFK